MDAAQNGNSKTFLTSGEVGQLLGCSSFWINQLIKAGELDTHRIGERGWHRISRRSLDEYAKRHEIALDWANLQ